MKITIVTDAWSPQVNGVVRTLKMMCEQLSARGHELQVISPDLFWSMPCPTYPEIRLAPFARRKVAKMIRRFAPEVIHIATEGPLGLTARQICVRNSFSFTTAYHTKFPEYVNARTHLPVNWGYQFLRWFHSPSEGVMVATNSIDNELKSRGICNTRRWSRGVDIELFHPRHKKPLECLEGREGPTLVYVGRVAVEKNIEAFLKLDHPGTKLIVGDGPQRQSLERDYPDAIFVGSKSGEELAQHFAAGDVFVFPSLTDTFGLVMLEAMACGVPVVGYPVAGPIDVVGAEGRGTRTGWDEPVGAVDKDLSKAIERALKIKNDAPRRYAEFFSWEACADQFLANLVQNPEERIAELSEALASEAIEIFPSDRAA
ncbi:MAG: glycosyltransferase family 1 protein [Pseudomonadota bacterium]